MLTTKYTTAITAQFQKLAGQTFTGFSIYPREKLSLPGRQSPAKLKSSLWYYNMFGEKL